MAEPLSQLLCLVGREMGTASLGQHQEGVRIFLSISPGY